MPRIYIYDRPNIAAEIEKNKDLLPHAEYVKRFVAHFSSFTTNSPEEADAFIVPINLIHYQFAKPQIDPWEYIKSLPHLDKGNHVIWATGDYGQRKRGAYESFHEGRAYPELFKWLDHRIRLVVFESTPDCARQDIAVLPYVLDPKKPGFWQFLTRSKQEKRDLLYSFCGKLSYHPLLPSKHIRGGVFEKLAGIGKDFFIGTAADAEKNYGKKGEYHSIFKRSVFTLCPAGFGRWTFRLSEALEYGSIPILISDDYVLPCANIVPWNDLVIRVEEKDVLNVPEIVRNITQEEIVFRQNQISKYAHLLGEAGTHEFLAKSLGSRTTSS